MSSINKNDSLSKPTDWREWLNDLVRYKDTTVTYSYTDTGVYSVGFSPTPAIASDTR